jgi:primosomal protein N'
MPENQSVYSFALNLPLYQLFDYQLDGAVKAQPGQRFLVPFGSSDKVGIVVQRLDDPAQVRELKAVTRALDEHSLLSPHMIAG